MGFLILADEFLDLVYSDRLVDRSSRTSVLAAAVAYSSADSRGTGCPDGSGVQLRRISLRLPSGYSPGLLYEPDMLSYKALFRTHSS